MAGLASETSHFHFSEKKFGNFQLIKNCDKAFSFYNQNEAASLSSLFKLSLGLF